MLLFELLVENNKHTGYGWRGGRRGGGGGGVWFVLFSEATPFENNVSTILPPILVSPDQHLYKQTHLVATYININPAGCSKGAC